MEEFNEDDSHSRYGRINAEFLNAIDPESRHRIVALIANHYGISVPEILTEVTDVAAEDILDYMAGNDRLATSLLKQRHGLK
ncbi:MAG: hypothetical protein EOO52_13615 [Gammaproteobacteria bacterium]|nr:MAG: hypothetical protein EOO52_13615 [Gammaproteobacteria bacterium]